MPAGDMNAARAFVGADCALCKETGDGWHVSKKRSTDPAQLRDAAGGSLICRRHRTFSRRQLFPPCTVKVALGPLLAAG